MDLQKGKGWAWRPNSVPFFRLTDLALCQVLTLADLSRGETHKVRLALHYRQSDYGPCVYAYKGIPSYANAKTNPTKNKGAKLSSHGGWTA